MRLAPHSVELALLGRLFDVKFQDLTPQFPLFNGLFALTGPILFSISTRYRTDNRKQVAHEMGLHPRT